MSTNKKVLSIVADVYSKSGAGAYIPLLKKYSPARNITMNAAELRQIVAANCYIRSPEGRIIDYRNVETYIAATFR